MSSPVKGADYTAPFTPTATVDSATNPPVATTTAFTSAPVGADSGSNMKTIESIRQQLQHIDRQRRELESELSLIGSDDNDSLPTEIDASAMMKESSQSAGQVPKEENQASAVLLKRAKLAERKLELLLKQMAATQSAADSIAPTSSTPAAASANASNAVNMELRRAQRRIKELEQKLQQTLATHVPSNSASGPVSHTTTTANGIDPKAAANAEKVHQRRIKEMETAFRKEKNALEARAIQAEQSLRGNSDLIPTLTAERDGLLTQVQSLNKIAAEVEGLRAVAGEAAALQISLQEQRQAMTQLEESFKRETLLRKKYKNELEDLKGSSLNITISLSFQCIYALHYFTL